MILKASQRGNARELAQHLMNAEDNERVELHAVHGFIGNTVHDALTEIEAISRGTKCSQPLFSVSLNPPKDKSASIADFENAIARIAEKNGLQEQPHVIVFHEKNGRRHAHCVWSRIQADSMTAINLPFYKNRLMEISKDLYLDHGWELPKGHINKERTNPLNFTLAQWQQAKRLNENPRTIKQHLRECWAISDTAQSFSNALKQHGYLLAKGDRRGFVAVDWRGEIYSLSRWTGVKPKILIERLGDPESLPSVEETKVTLDQQLQDNVRRALHEIEQRYKPRFMPLRTHKSQMKERHDTEREALAQQQTEQQNKEMQERQARFNKRFLGGLWDRVNGRHSQIRKQNEREAYQSFKRDQEAKDALIHRQLEMRRSLQENLDTLNNQQQKDVQSLKMALFSKLPDEKTQHLHNDFEQHSQPPEQNHDMEM